MSLRGSVASLCRNDQLAANLNLSSGQQGLPSLLFDIGPGSYAGSGLAVAWAICSAVVMSHELEASAAVRPTPPDPQEFEKLTTPERIDRLNVLRAQHAGLLDKRAEAAKRFYATLTPSQRKVFDLETLKYVQPRDKMRWLHQPMHREDPRK